MFVTTRRACWALPAAALVVVGAAGCSSHHKSADGKSTPSASGGRSASAASSGPNGRSASTPGGSGSRGASSGDAGSAPSSSGAPAGAGSAPAGGAEGARPATGAPCRVASASDVVAAFGGKVGSQTSGTSGIGNPLCTFHLTKSNAGLPGTVSVTVNAKSSAATFAQIKKHESGAIAVSGVGSNAFYVAKSGTLQFIKGSTVVVIQATLRAPGSQPAKASQVRTDMMALGKSIAAIL
jgi:hypothetical protein